MNKCLISKSLVSIFTLQSSTFLTHISTCRTSCLTYLSTGCPPILFTLCFLQFSQLSEHSHSKYHMFSSCPFRSLLENDQDRWIWVNNEKVIKENVRRGQNKFSQNIFKKRWLIIPIWTLRAQNGCHMEPFGLLILSLWPPLVLYGPPTDPPWFPLSQIGPPLVFKWLPKDPIWPSRDPNGPYGPIMATYGTFWSLMGPLLSPK